MTSGGELLALARRGRVAGVDLVGATAAPGCMSPIDLIGSPGELPPPAPTPPDVPIGIRRFTKCAQASDARRGS